MKNEKVQVEILKELLKPSARGCYWRDEEEDKIVVIPAGVVGYRLNESGLKVNLDGAQTMVPLLDRVTDLATGVALEATDRYRAGGKAREFWAFGDENRPVYVDVKLLSNFDEPKLFQREYSPSGLVTIAEYFLETDSLVVVGYVCPVRIMD